MRIKRILFLAALMAALAAVSALSSGMLSRMDADAPAKLEAAVRQAAVACYSTEGLYPESVKYLEDNYGLRPDPGYAIHYRVFGSNIPPEIVVTAK